MENKRNIQVLFQKYIENRCTKEEFYELMNLLSLSENTKFLDEQIKLYWEDLETRENVIDAKAETAMLSRFREKAGSRIIGQAAQRRINPYVVLARIAATIVILISLAIVVRIFISSNNTKNQPVLMHALPSPSITSTANPGERLKLKLSDGSQVVIKAGSQLTSPTEFQGPTRNISLNGEAFFRVAHNENMPFIIHTRKLTVKVLGTSFNVHSYDRDTYASVGVVTGKVEVSIENHSGSKTDRFILLPGDQVNLNTLTGKTMVKHSNTNQYKAWAANELDFDQTPLPEVIKKIEDCYGVSIKLNIADAGKTKITGIYKNDSLAGILQLLTFSTGTAFTREGVNVTIYKK